MATLLTLTALPAERQRQLLVQWLQADDHLLVREDARSLARCPVPVAARAWIRRDDAARLGGSLHPDWQIISDDDWVALVDQCQPVVTW
ncbi:MAG: hypothetical protein ACX931_00485 [Saccharospirillum sp.]